MTTKNFSERFPCSDSVEILTIKDLIEWQEANVSEDSRLLLPSIQRSIVWSNEQVINYWDSLLRGYPAGTMMVHRVASTSSKARDTEGKTINAKKDDFLLFDGQQRMTAILLGFGKGQMKDSCKLWVDFGGSKKNPKLKFQLRITSTGQPFGYRPDLPNQKIKLGKRHEKWANILEKDPNLKPQEVFKADVNGSYIIDAECPVSFHDICALTLLDENKLERAIGELAKEKNAPKAEACIKEFVCALKKST